MISQKKLEANRRNAEKSTGPRTEEGKARSCQNGLTHGLTSKKFPILPGENEQEFREFHDAMIRDLKPRGIMQREIVEDLIQARWKMKRLPQIEAELMRRKQQKLQDEYEERRKFKYNRDLQPPILDPIKLLTDYYGDYGDLPLNLDLYRQRLQREMHTLLRELRKLREETGDEEDQCDAGFDSTELAEVRPAQSEQQAVDERSCKTEPTEHGPACDELSRVEAHVTRDQDVQATEDAIRKTEPTVECKPLLALEKHSRDEVSASPKGESDRFTPR